MKLSFLLLIFLVFYFFQLSAQVVINELNPAPVAGEPEWIELLNTDSLPHSLLNFKLNDKTTSISLPDVVIPAGGFVLVCRDTIALREVRTIPVAAILIEAKLPSLNNTTDAMVLRGADSTVIDSVYYSMKWGKKGISLERIDPLFPAVSQSNFSYSLSRDSATAGYANSIVLLDHDALVSEIAPVGRDSVKITVKNNGKLSLNNIEITLFQDKNSNGRASASELVLSQKIPTMKTKESQSVKVSIANLPKGWQKFIAVCNVSDDERTQNDTLAYQIFHSYNRGTLLVNEIQFDPIEGDAEFVELYNTSADTISLSNWRLHDASVDTLSIISTNFRILPRTYVVISWDSLLFGQFPELHGNNSVLSQKFTFNLNAEGDDIVLFDPNGVVMDSLHYSPKWHSSAVASSKGRSLEKINPHLPSIQADVWTTCGDVRGATPARENSVSVEIKPDGILSATPNPFSISGKTGDGICAISYSLPFRQALISATIFNANGVLLRTLSNASFTSSQGVLVWNGLDESGQKQPVGPYIVLLEATDSATGETRTDKLLVVIAP